MHNIGSMLHESCGLLRPDLRAAPCFSAPLNGPPPQPKLFDLSNSYTVILQCHTKIDKHQSQLTDVSAIPLCSLSSFVDVIQG